MHDLATSDVDPDVRNRVRRRSVKYEVTNFKLGNRDLATRVILNLRRVIQRDTRLCPGVKGQARAIESSDPGTFSEAVTGTVRVAAAP